VVGIDARVHMMPLPSIMELKMELLFFYDRGLGYCNYCEN
jgi:hypothetical protein